MTKEDWRFALGYGVALIAFIVLVFILIMSPARAHDWYPLSCCSTTDCQPIPPEAVKVTKEGWQIVATGEVIGWKDHRLRDTPPEGEGLFHWCRHLKDRPATAWSTGVKAGTTICLYVPPGGV